MANPIRLLVLTPEYRHYGGGITTYYRALLPALVKAGCTVKVFEGSAALTSPDSCPVEIDGVRVETLEADRVSKWETRLTHLSAAPSLMRAVAASWALWEQSESAHECDVIEATDFGLPFIAPLLSSPIPLVLQMHGSLGQIAKHDPDSSRSLDGILELAIESQIGARAEEVQSPSVANAEFWTAEMGRDVRCQYPAWSPVDKLDNSAALTPRLSVFGRVQRWKGPHILCDALRLLGDRAPDVDWYGKDTQYLRKGHSCSTWLAAAYPDVWGVKVRWHKPVSPSQVARIQAQSQFNLVPSTWDVFNYTAVEALGSGRPLICSLSAGVSELVQDGINGLVYQNNNPADLARAIDRALALTESQQAELACAARILATRELNPEKVAAERMTRYRACQSAKEQRLRATLPEWIISLCTPDQSPHANTHAFLDQVPLGALLRYAGQRALRKIGSV